MCDFYKIGNKTICRLGEFLFVISIWRGNLNTDTF